jgi:hypothetical protein
MSYNVRWDNAPKSLVGKGKRKYFIEMALWCVGTMRLCGRILRKQIISKSRSNILFVMILTITKKNLPIEFYKQIVEILAMFWRIILEDLYPNGDWVVEIQDDTEMTVEAIINCR